MHVSDGHITVVLLAPNHARDNGRRQPAIPSSIRSIEAAIDAADNLYKTPSSSLSFAPDSTTREPPGCPHLSSQLRRSRRRPSSFPANDVHLSTSSPSQTVCANDLIQGLQKCVNQVKMV